MMFQPSVLYGAANYLSGRILIKPIHKHDVYSFAVRDLYLRTMRELCQARGNCVVQDDRVIYPELDFHFTVTVDATTLELIHKPLTSSMEGRLLSTIQSDMFDVPRTLGLNVSSNDYIGAGHMHMDLGDAFGDDAELFRNFVVDYLNHAALYTGILGHDPMEGKDILAQRKTFAAYRQIIEDFDKKKIVGLHQLRLRLADIGFRKVSYTTQKPALNLDTKHGTIEFRAIRSYQSAQDVFLIMKLFEARLRLMKTQTTPVRVRQHSLRPQDKASKVVEFYNYVTQAGLDWDQYRHLVPVSYQAYRFDPQREAWTTAPESSDCLLVISRFTL